MYFLRAFKVALAALAANKLRSILAVLGIVIGVGAVIAMVSTVEGAKVRVRENFERMGTNLIWVYPNSRSRGHSRARTAESETLTMEDLNAMKLLPHVNVAVPEVRDGCQVKYMNRNDHARVNGTLPDHLIARNFEIERGRYFDDNAVRGRMRVCVMGARVAEELFEEIDPVGREIQINRKNYEVLGVLKDKGGDTWARLDETIYVPVTTAMYRIFNQRHLDQLTISVDKAENVEAVKGLIDQELRRRHGTPLTADEDDADFRIRAMDDYRERYTRMADTMWWTLFITAAISLVVGGIGIMNIMLVSVTERTREIGIRKAIGARRSDITKQFLIESVTISLMGGIFGIAAGIAGALLLPGIQLSRSRSGGESEIPAVISMEAIVIAFAFSCFVGIFFGIYPALKASRLSPVDALRYE